MSDYFKAANRLTVLLVLVFGVVALAPRHASATDLQCARACHNVFENCLGICQGEEGCFDACNTDYQTCLANCDI
jgi:hypothetical protein